MMRRILLFIFLMIFLLPFTSAQTKISKGNTAAEDLTVSDFWHKAMKKAAEATGTEYTDPHQEVPRVVPRGGKPEIILAGDGILFNGKRLKLGQSANQWDEILPGDRRCDNRDDPNACAWDELGILVGFSYSKPKKITFVTFYLRLKMPDLYESAVTDLPDGTPLKKVALVEPAQAYRGYIELDGYGIDNKTRLWEVFKKADVRRKIHCGLRECVSPSGAFGEKASIYFGLDEPSESGVINSIQISTTNK